MLFNYYSNWILIIFLIWSLGYIFHIRLITDNIHPYYATILTSIGFTLLLSYYIIYKHYQFQDSFLLVIALLHYIPLYISYKYAKKSKSFLLLIITLLLYNLYMIFMKKNPINIYLIDKNPSSWNDIRI